MKRIGNVIATVLVVTLNSKSGQQRRTLKIAFSDSQGIAVVGLALRSSVVHKHVQAVAEYMFVGHLRSVVVSVAVLGHEVHVWREVRIGDERFVVGNSRR